MKKSIGKIAGFLSMGAVTAYFVWFCINVKALAGRHLDEDWFYPRMCFWTGIIIGCGMLIYGIITRKKNNFWFVPLLYIVAGIITGIIGANTLCCTGG